MDALQDRWHQFAHISRSSQAKRIRYFPNNRLDLVIRHLLRQILSQDSGLTLLHFGKIVPATVTVEISGFHTLLDLGLNHAENIVVREIPLQIDLLVSDGRPKDSDEIPTLGIAFAHCDFQIINQSIG